MKFAERLKKCREEKKKENSKWTQNYVAEKIGVARVTYTAYENGTKLPPLDTVDRIASLLDVTTDYLLGRTDTPRKSEEEKDFESFINDSDLERWYKELPKNKEEDLRRLRKIWEAFNEDDK